MSKLTDILDKTVFQPGSGPNGSGGEWVYGLGQDYEQPLEQAILALIAEAIGPDEIPNPEWELSTREYGHNELRAEIRERLGL